MAPKEMVSCFAKKRLRCQKWQCFRTEKAVRPLIFCRLDLRPGALGWAIILARGHCNDVRRPSFFCPRAGLFRNYRHAFGQLSYHRLELFPLYFCAKAFVHCYDSNKTGVRQ
jgi:hypothetical protein